MSDVAAVQPQSRRSLSQQARRERIPPRIVKAVRLLSTGECKTQKAAAIQAGLNETYLSEALRKPKIQAFIEREARQTIARGLMRASARSVELLDADSEHVAADMTKWHLAVAGIKPADGPTIVNNINVMTGYVIDLAGGGNETA